MGYITRISIATIAVLLLGTTDKNLYAQSNTNEQDNTINLQQQVDSLCNNYLQKKETSGLFVGIIQDGKLFAKGYGVVDKKTNTTPDSTTIFEIGSITKTFTTALAQVLVDKGELSWDDRVGARLPEHISFPKDDSTTLRHLASHTSGFPGLPKAWIPKIVFNMCNPYSKFEEEDLVKYLDKAKGKKAPSPENYEYSNLGMGLLGHILTWKTGKSYEELLQQYICKPLQMPNTSTTVTDASKFATGYDEKGNETCHWDLPIIPGAGTIKSNGADMLRYLQAHMANTTPISNTLMKTHEPVAKIASGHIAYGWHIDTRNGSNAGIEKIIWHNGGTGGFRTYIGFIPGSGKGVIVLSNQFNNDLDRLAIDILLKAATVSLK